MEFISTNHHILEKIFTSSKNSTLLQCRLVCRLWADEVTRILRKRGVTISFRSTDDIEEFLEVARPLSQTYTSFLVDIPSPRSPSAVVEQVPSQVVDLLDCYRDDILELKLWYQPILQEQHAASESQEDNSGLDDQRIINNAGEPDSEVVTFTKLHTLHLLSNYVHPTAIAPGGQPQPPQAHQMPKYFTHICTPSLRSLAIQHLYDTECASVVIKLIENSGNSLEKFKIPAKPFPLVASATPSLLHLRELDLYGIFHGFSCATNDTLEALIKFCPRLEKLGIEFSFRATLDKIQEMFAKLANTLVELKCTIQDRNLLARQIIRVDFIFPEMLKLKVLQMRWSNPGLVYYIDRLPVLEELMLETAWTRKVQGSIFPGGQPFQDGMAQYGNLRSLKLTEVVSVEQVDVFAKYFPNLQVLGCSFVSNEALRMVYEKISRLKWLIIDRKSNVTEAGGICGIDDEEEMGRQLGMLNDDNLEEESLQLTRNVPHIGDLKELETLELCQLGISWWSLLYGVINLPKLKTLVIQSKAFRKSSSNSAPNVNNNDLINFLAPRLKQLRNLTLWIRHTSERPSPEDLNALQQALYHLEELAVANHSLCGI